jgi:hypothetical protein
MNEDKLHAATVRRARAEALLNNELLKEIFRDLEADLHKTWSATTLPETAAREKLWTATQVLGDIRNMLYKAIGDGKVAQAQIDQMAGLNRAA